MYTIKKYTIKSKMIKLKLIFKLKLTKMEFLRHAKILKLINFLHV